MEAVDWTALSVLTVVVLGAVGYLARDTHRQLDRLEARFDTRIDALETRFDTRIDALEARFDTRFDALEERYIRHLEAHATH